jgi:GntR family transcriptional regulator
MPELNQNTGIPLYIQIREALLQEIQQKKFQKGQQLPTEEELSREFNVSRMTVRQALGEMVREGVLERRRGIGTFVVSQHMTRHYTRLNSFYEEAQDQGLKPSSVIVEMKIIPADEEVAAKLDINGGDEVHFIKRLRMLNDDPIALHLVRLPCKLFPGLRQDHLSGSLYSFYQEQNKPATWGLQRIEARVATHEQSQLLKLPKNAPILYSGRVTYTRNDVPIEWVEAFAGGAPYAIEITLNREG